MSNDLKPCPFCGDTAHLRLKDSRWSISCGVCRISIGVDASTVELGATVYEYESREAALAVWNRRSPCRKDLEGAQLLFENVLCILSGKCALNPGETVQSSARKFLIDACEVMSRLSGGWQLKHVLTEEELLRAKKFADNWYR